MLDSPSWSTWLSTSGLSIWALRAAFRAAHPAGCALVAQSDAVTGAQPAARGAPGGLTTLLVTEPAVFVAIEQALGGAAGLAKPSKGNGHLAHALTGVNGADWARQRIVLTARVLPVALGGGRPLALAEGAMDEALAALEVLFARSPPGARVQLDLKAVLEPACARWIVALVLGGALGGATRSRAADAAADGSSGGASGDAGGRAAEDGDAVGARLRCEAQARLQPAADALLAFWAALRARGAARNAARTTLAPLRAHTRDALACARRARRDACAQLQPSGAEGAGASAAALCAGGGAIVEAMAAVVIAREHASAASAAPCLSAEECEANCISFLTAGFETALSLAVWTLLQLGDGRRARLRRAVRMEAAAISACGELARAQIALLAQIKAHATTGCALPAELSAPAPLPDAPLPDHLPDAPPSPARPRDGGCACPPACGTPLLVRCLLRSLLVCPPVLNLPRTYPAQHAASVRDADGGGYAARAWERTSDWLRDSAPGAAERGASAREHAHRSSLRADVLCCNGVEIGWPAAGWEPLDAHTRRVCSFGLGERSCPAGTAALVASWTFCRRLLAIYDLAEPTDAAGPASKAYLAPTLCTLGAQHVVLTRAPV